MDEIKPLTDKSAQDMLNTIADACNGRIEEAGQLPDGSGFATMSMPLPKDHWLTKSGWNEPPMTLRAGDADKIMVTVFRDGEESIGTWSRQQFADEVIRPAIRYAIRASTMNGTEEDFDPDAMVQNAIVGLLGYWTADGFSKITYEGGEPK